VPLNNPGRYLFLDAAESVLRPSRSGQETRLLT
jgi:hypothetical protein